MSERVTLEYLLGVPVDPGNNMAIVKITMVAFEEVFALFFQFISLLFQNHDYKPVLRDHRFENFLFFLELILVKYAKKRQAGGAAATIEKVTWQNRCKRSAMVGVPAFFVIFIFIFYSIAIFGLFRFRSGSAWYTFVAVLAQVVKIGGNKLQILLMKGDIGWMSGGNMFMVSLMLLN